ncbi:MAG TPA: MATE family efflux transporter [Rhizomicrobium sp.]|nr:MATE family efflux transporter [Rhizomicrobium sp.]
MTDIAELDLTHAGARVTGHGLDAWMAEIRELLKLAGPLVVTQLAQMAIMTTDVLMLGHYSNTALASAQMGNTAFFFCWILGCGPVAAVSPMIAHILGARPSDRAGVRAVVRMGFWSVIITSIPLIVLLSFFVKPAMLAFHEAPELARGAATFTGVLCFGLPFSLGYQVLRNYSTALSRPKASLWVMLAAILFNLFGDYALIFGHFGAPRLGILGSALASTCSYAFSFLSMLAVVHLMPGLSKYRILRRFFRVHWEKLGEVFRLGAPIGFTMMFEAMLFNVSMLVMGAFGTVYAVAHTIALNVPSITFMVPLGIGMAATVRVGLAAGARDGEAVRRAGYGAMLAGACFMAAMSVLIWSFPETIARLYVDGGAQDAVVVGMAVVFLHVVAAFQIFDGLQVVSALSLRGLKDANAPMWIAGGSYWLAGAPMCAWLAFGLHMKGLGIWIGLAFGLLVAAAAMTARFWFLSRER